MIAYIIIITSTELKKNPNYYLVGKAQCHCVSVCSHYSCLCISGCIRWKVDKIMQSLGHSHLLLHKTQSYTEHTRTWVLVSPSLSPSCPQTHPNRCVTRRQSEAIICEVPLQFTWVDKGGCYWFSGPEGESNLSDRWGIKQTESQESQSHWGRTCFYR